MMTLNLDEETASLLRRLAEREHIPAEQVVKNALAEHESALNPKPEAGQGDFFSCAGIWQGRDITQDSLRAVAWRDNTA